MISLKERKKIMIEYLRLKLSEEDWHGVQDAASDLREIEVELRLMENQNNALSRSLS